ncbi:Alpha/Beta hydrolase protein [Amylocarpus encephaloides]|uniref:Alpha/Beta hydrolase protein n=1 Tax=Amylocarpus encephaloides TaxID=45428 RepID=A0A9P7YT28_9HELO|nr:Alpha/Beta hydrolase protein [Amylocarpus encephaloides]
MLHTSILLHASSLLALATCNPINSPLTLSTPPSPNHNITIPLFSDLEQLSRLVDIAYCVGGTGISHPFLCASRCGDFPSFELVTEWCTGELLSDGCGYIALDNKGGRVVVAFRGTYSISDTIVDLSTVPQAYVPYPEDGKTGEEVRRGGWKWWGWIPVGYRTDDPVLGMVEKEKRRCENCTVHTGFWSAWQNTRPFVLPPLEEIKKEHPEYRIDLVGHSLGGAVAALAGLEFEGKGWEPVLTTFGEPRIGNGGLRDYLDANFHPDKEGEGDGGRYRRVTHVDDPVPLLPLQEWGYRPHAGEIYISKPALQPALHDVRLCDGDEDLDCIAGADVEEDWFGRFTTGELERYMQGSEMVGGEEQEVLAKRWGIPIPSRYKMWQLFFAHRDYFWRLGLCVPGGDPLDWGRERYGFGEEDGKSEVQSEGEGKGKGDL